MDKVSQINNDHLTGELTPMHPQDVFLSMGLGRDPAAMSLTPQEHDDGFFTALEGSFSENFGAITKGAIAYAARSSFVDPNFVWKDSPLLKARGNGFILRYKDGLSAISSEVEMSEALKVIDDSQRIAAAVDKHPVAGFVGGMLGAAPEAIAMVLPGAAATSLAVRALSTGASGALYGGLSTLGRQQIDSSVTNEDIFDNSIYGAVLTVGLPLLFHGLGSKQMKGVVDFMGAKIKKPNAAPEEGELPDVISQLPNKGNQSIGAASTKLDEFGELDVVPSEAISYDEALDKIIPKNTALPKNSTVAQKIEHLDKLQEQGLLNNNNYQKIKEAINNNEPVYEPTLAGKVFTAARKFVATLAPSQDAQLSDFAATRQWGNETYLSNLTKNKNTEGVGSQNSIFADLESAVGNQQYRFNTGLNEAMRAEGLDPETADANVFMKKVVDDLMTNKNTPGGSFLRKFNNDYAKNINEKKILKDGVLVDENGNYFVGSLSRDKIASDPKGFMDMTEAKVERDRQEASGKLKDLIESTIKAEKAAAEEVQPKEFGKRLKATDQKPFNADEVAARLENTNDANRISFLKNSKYLNPEERETLSQLEETLLTKETTNEVATNVMNKFLNPEGQRRVAKGSGGEVKAKTINYSYEEAKKYLPENLIQAQTNYIRNMELRFLIKDRYGVDKNEYVKTIQDKIQAEAEPMIINAKDGAEVKRLTDRAAKDKQMVADTFDVLDKKYDQPHTAAGVVVRAVSRIAQMWQATRYLGLAALANLPDLSNLAGIKNALWLGKGVAEGLEHMDTIKLGAEESEFMHVTMSEMAPTNAAMELIGQDANGALTENMGKLDKAVNLLDKGQRKFFKYSGFNWFVNTERQIAGSFIADKILKAAQQLEAGVLEKGTKEFNDLHKFGIDKNNVKEIMDEVRAHGVTKEGVLGNKYLYPNVHEWTPNVGVDFTSKLLREVENTVSAKSVGDAPFWTNTAWGRMFTQFKGWQFGALNRQILPMIQGWGMGKEYKAMVLSRIIANMCWANITNYAYNIASGRPEKNILDPQHMLYNGFNRGNLFPFIADLSNMADSYGAGIGSALGVNNNSRYYNTDMWGKMAPGLALPADIIKTAHSVHRILTGNATGADYYQGFRMFPGSNAPLIGWMGNQLKNNQFGGS